MRNTRGRISDVAVPFRRENDAARDDARRRNSVGVTHRATRFQYRKRISLVTTRTHSHLQPHSRLDDASIRSDCQFSTDAMREECVSNRLLLWRSRGSSLVCDSQCYFKSRWSDTHGVLHNGDVNNVFQFINWAMTLLWKISTLSSGKFWFFSIKILVDDNCSLREWILKRCIVDSPMSYWLRPFNSV